MNFFILVTIRFLNNLEKFGDFCRFSARSLGWLFVSISDSRQWTRMLRQFYEIGTLSIPVVMITGMFVGMVLAVQSANQFMEMGMIAQMGILVNLSVLRELGPVLAGIMLAGRVGGGLTAQLGTMRVTEQIDALRAMGADPIRVLVVPRFLACILLIPVLVLYADFMGIWGGYAISVYVYGITRAEFWAKAPEVITLFDLIYGPIKCVFFGAAISLISCYNGFRCGPGAEGVGKACTKAFVTSCMAILCLDLFLGMLLNTLQQLIWGFQQILV